jgi:Histidine phosphatase superfamily (branch 2)
VPALCLTFLGLIFPSFSVPSDISAEVPNGCRITLAQILSRHGSRDPTASKTKSYNDTITAIKANVTTFTGKYGFLNNYDYLLGADQLTTFGQNELVNSGIKFFERCSHLAASSTPFVRSSSEARVVKSAQNWTQGYHNALVSAGFVDAGYPFPIIVISEDPDSNNTLNHAICTNFESDEEYYSSIASNAQKKFAATFVPAIRQRLEADLPGAQLSTSDVISLMDLCPFNTVANSHGGSISTFCALFTESEWHAYNYYETLNKYYGYGAGNPVGPTQGVGWTNELIARLTGTPVVDHTSTNRTLDMDPATFPLDRKLYADFSHDNDMTAIMHAIGLYNSSTPMLSNTTVTEAGSAGGYSASWTVPFAGRLHVEKMVCDCERTGLRQSNQKAHARELVRVIVNDRVIRLPHCGADELGRCEVGPYVESLSFARSGGRWTDCFNQIRKRLNNNRAPVR